LKTPPILSAADRTTDPVADFATTPSEPLAAQAIDTSFLESLMGYNTRRASLAILERFMQEMAVYDLRPVSFSVLSLIGHNPGITSRQLCAALGLLPPNLVAMVNALQKRALIERRPHPSDRRAVSLHASVAGHKLLGRAEHTAARLEADATAKLTPAESKTLLRLLRKIYL
jgi:DNA-binding MarR family transcriptional regulator